MIKRASSPTVLASVASMALTFLLGAGFSVDAAAEAGFPASTGYPLTDDLLARCFGLTALPSGTA